MVLIKPFPDIKPFKDAIKDNFRYIPPIQTCSFDRNKYNTRFFTSIPYVVIAAIVAFIGLAQNDSTIIIASMLFSPIGGQIIRSSAGIMSGNGPQIQIGVLNHMLYVAIIWIIGLLMGISMTDKEDKIKENSQMMNRAKWTDSFSSIFNSIVLAAVSGIVLGLSHRDNDTSLVIAIGIGASLLPPIVNSGMLTAYAIKHPDSEISYGKLAGKSLALWFVNYLIILLVISIIFKIYCH